MLAKVKNSISEMGSKFTLGKGAIDAIKPLLRLYSDTKVHTSSGVIDADSNAGQFLSQISQILLGSSLPMPNIWSGTTFNSSLSVRLKLIAPDGHPDTIKEYITDPLKVLTSMAGGINVNGWFVNSPIQWEVHIPGIAYIRSAMITSLTVTKTLDSAFNVYGQPTSVDVSMLIIPMIQGHATVTKGDGVKDMWFNTYTSVDDSMKSFDKLHR